MTQPTNPFGQFEFLPKGWMEGITAHHSFIDEFVRSMEAQRALLLAEQSKWLGMHEAIAKTLEPFRRTFAEIAANQIRDKRIEASGWLPHYTTPIDAVSEASDVEAISNLLEKHYSAQWPAVKAAFLQKLESYDVDAEAKECFREALDCHGNGSYRATVRLLFPEIERIVRNEILGGKLDGIASLTKFREAVGHLPAGEINSRSRSGMALYKRLLHHLYAPANKPPLVASIANDSVPNRHAALHGLVVYKTRRNSINALIMADFAFLLVSILIAVREQDADAFTELVN